MSVLRKIFTKKLNLFFPEKEVVLNFDFLIFFPHQLRLIKNFLDSKSSRISKLERDLDRIKKRKMKINGEEEDIGSGQIDTDHTVR